MYATPFRASQTSMSHSHIAPKHIHTFNYFMIVSMVCKDNNNDYRRRAVVVVIKITTTMSGSIKDNYNDDRRRAVVVVY